MNNREYAHKILTDARRFFEEGRTVHHVTRGKRTMAIRPREGGAYGAYDVQVSRDEELLNLYGMSYSELIQFLEDVFLERGHHPENEAFTREINQGKRFCEVVKVNPTRVRVEYEMPNAGYMGGWVYYIDLLGCRFYMNQHQRARIAAILEKRGR